MKTMLLATTAALSLGIGSAWAGDGDGSLASTHFTNLPGVQSVVPVRAFPWAGTAHDGAIAHAFVATPHSLGTWIFPPNQTGGGPR
jgi:hypothetical protein